MKTFNGKNITKKYITTVLRTMDSTQIYRLVHIIYGEVSKVKVCRFIHEFAPTVAIDKAAYNIAFNPKERMNSHHFQSARKTFEFEEANRKSIVIAYLKEQIQDVHSNYAKRPMMGHTHLYFCSPVYGHRDYNKWMAMPIEGNEKFCETVIAYADKFFAPVYDK